MKRVLIVSDYHCGHIVGLTPPGWQLTPADERASTKRDKFITVQRACWQFYDDIIKKHGPFDVIVANGDLIDGDGWRSGGTEQHTLDRLHQCEMATYALRAAMSKWTKVFVTVGTAYHTGQAEDFETVIANDVKAEKIGSHEWVDVEGVVFDCKHHLGSSSVPHGRHTAIARDYLWSILWAERGLAPKADVIIRSHVHYHNYCGGPGWLALTTPALQGYGTKYGGRRCSGIVDFGATIFNVDKGSYSWYTVISKSPALCAKVIKA
jgi:hypothetical protein